MLRRLAFLAIALPWLTACQTSLVRAFDKLHPGMDKHQVLETVGNPSTTTRMHGKDRWIYKFYDDGIAFEKEVHFLGGNAVYVGDAWAPPSEKAAPAVDKVNAEKEAVLQAETAAREEARKKNAEMFRNYERETQQPSKVKYLPSFVDL